MLTHLLNHRTAGFFSLSLLLSTTNVVAQPARGKMLYDNHCLECHITEIHFRAKSKVKTVKELHQAVIRWKEELGLNWSSQDVLDVQDYLNEKYYQFKALNPM